MSGATEHHGPEPPSDLLLATCDVLALRLHGRPRDPTSGMHRQVVVFAEPTMTAQRLAGFLRDAAERLVPATGRIPM